MSRRKATAIDRRIRNLGDTDLGALITELAQLAPMVHSMLAEASREERRRTRRAAKDTAAK